MYLFYTPVSIDTTYGESSVHPDVSVVAKYGASFAELSFHHGSIRYWSVENICIEMTEVIVLSTSANLE